MVPVPLHDVAIAALCAGFACAVLLAADLVRSPQKMWIMNVVWPVTALYLGPLAVWLYFRYGKSEAKKPFWAVTAVGVTHCGAGCTLGDVISEFALFAGGAVLAGSFLNAAFIGDFAAAYVLGIIFQYFSIAPMRGLSGFAGIRAAIKADTLSLTAFEAGLFVWMWLVSSFFRPELKPDMPTYWFSMQIGMTLGFATAYPMNWWLIKRGIKEAM